MTGKNRKIEILVVPNVWALLNLRPCGNEDLQSDVRNIKVAKSKALLDLMI